MLKVSQKNEKEKEGTPGDILLRVGLGNRIHFERTTVALRNLKGRHYCGAVIASAEVELPPPFN